MVKGRVALVLCPCWTNFCPPLGIAYLAAVAKNKGYGAKCFDLNIGLYNLLKKEKVNYWDFKEHYYWDGSLFLNKILPLISGYLDAKADQILSYQPDLIGFSTFVTNAAASLYLAQRIKQIDPSKKIIFGGQDCYKEIKDHRFLNSGFVDMAVVGEGEITLADILQAYPGNGRLDNIKGTLIKKDGRIIVNEPREEIKYLDNLPFPDFTDFDLKQYKEFSLPIMTSRGCVARCVFCGEIRFWKKFRFRSAENIFREIKENVNRFGVKKFFFNDSLINGNLKELSCFVDLIVENKLDIDWGGYARVNKGMSLELLKRLRKANCSYLSYGIESGSQKVLNKMNKNISLKDAEMNLKNTVDSGIAAHVNWIVGFPTESWLDFFKSLYFIYKNRKNISHFNPGQVPCGIMPDSELASNPEYFGIVKGAFFENWRTKFFMNTIIHRKIRLKMLRGLISLLRISHS